MLHLNLYRPALMVPSQMHMQLDGPSALYPEDEASMIQNIDKYTLTHWITAELPTWPKSFLNDLLPREDGSIFRSGSHVFWKVCSGPYSGVHYRIVSVINTVLPEAEDDWRSKPSNIGFWPHPLCEDIFFPESLNFMLRNIINWGLPSPF